MANVPYLAGPNSIKTALERIKTAAVPEKVTYDFVSAKLLLTGGTGRAIPPYLKKIGFVSSDGSPTELYKRFRNSSQGPLALGEAIKIGYKELGAAHEYFYELDDKKLLDLIVQVTGGAPTDSVTKQTFGTLKAVRSLAKFDKGEDDKEEEGEAEKKSGTGEKEKPQREKHVAREKQQHEFNLAYTINLNLPATTDQAVFNAIFRSLREHLLDQSE